MPIKEIRSLNKKGNWWNVLFYAKLVTDFGKGVIPSNPIKQCVNSRTQEWKWYIPE